MAGRRETGQIDAANELAVRRNIALESLGATPVANTPEQFRAQIRDDLAKWARIIKLSGAKAD